MEILNKTSKEKPRNLWKTFDWDKYQNHVTVSSINSATKSEDIDDRENWCQSCNAKRFEENFKNWTSGNKDIDEFIQHSQLNAVHCTKCLEWIPFEKLQNVTYITRGGFGKIYSAEWPNGRIVRWDIENQKWKRGIGRKVALKSLDNSSEISTGFLDEIYIRSVIYCYGITQDPNTKVYMMVLHYCKNGNLRNFYLNEYDDNIKLYRLSNIANGLLDIHNAGKVHKDFHSGNILHGGGMYISDLGMCQPANNEEKSEKIGVYGVLPYMAPEVLRGYQYTKAADIYSFGIIMNEYLSEEIPFNDISHDHILAFKICKGLRPKISEHIPKFLVDLIMKCWDAKAENRPSAKELYQILNKWNETQYDDDEIYSQMNEYKKIREKKFKSRSNENKSESIKTHPQAIYTSRLLSFKNLPEPINSSDLTSFQVNSDDVPSISTNLISECLDVQLSESDLNEIIQEDNLNDET
ncbi:kinase-like domain-containing protein [Rhizophagus irregularis DAOM 181602=DAOM 197198]|uniref:Kinase-like domain-containing protein n=1 Tax=Rhizophagus irregularis (strain DAOM 181602 / DAOM 197198 / MUCL 43194) TaxID=747089 RepID=A0A2P4PEC1_RHIID|nr:kinase-like domain-containing protein [Rhizophagus irregularis DAOM 181602=DAOM 197198]POG63720.1 kinase-like domain-containing protein [Rhizophagus irregularis DAOM 181602=DAOM 197198]|eukprot:XP_025170586.1 kinase-like domain-containing protein [Rhizophagus irregularis DAOM 181602=DAOM 197198]